MNLTEIQIVQIL